MKKGLSISFILVLSLFTLRVPGASGSEDFERLGLLVIAHGAPMPAWNNRVLALEERIEDTLNHGTMSGFDEIRVALMEFNPERSVAAVLAEMEAGGITQVLALPLFIAPSDHTARDLPAILGHLFEPNLIRELREEGINLVQGDIRVTMGPTLNYGTVTQDILLDRLRAYSSAPESEAIILLAHGDRSHAAQWESLCRRIGNHLTARSGITYFDYAFVEVGQGFHHEGIPRILRAGKERKHVIVLGLYVSMGPELLRKMSPSPAAPMGLEEADPLDRVNVIFAKDGLLPSDRIVSWISEQANTWLKIMIPAEEEKP